MKTITRFLFFSFTVLLAGSNAYAQKKDAEIDSLVRQATSILYSYPDSSLALGKQIISLSRKRNYNSGLSYGYKILGAHAWKSGKLKLALENFYRQLDFAQKGHLGKEIISSYNNLGLIYTTLGGFDKGLQFLFKGLHYCDSLKIYSPSAWLYNNIGLTYEKMGNDSISLTYYLKAYNLTDKKDKDAISITLNNIGYRFIKLNKLTLAESYLKRSISSALEADNNYTACLALTNLGEVYARLHLPLKTLETNARAIELAKKYDDQEYLAVSMFSNALVYANAFKEYKRGIAIADSAIAIMEKVGNVVRLRDMTYDLSLMHENSGNTAAALALLKKYNALKDSVSNDLKTRSLNELQILHDIEDKQKEIVNLNRKSELAEIKVQKQQQLITFGIAGIFLLLVLVGLIYNRSVIRRKANTQIAAALTEVEEKNREVLDSINYAKRLQSAILPNESEWKRSFPDSFVLYLPKDIVAGDFYFLERRNNLVVFAAADSTGHGVPGALVSVVCSNALTRCISEFELTDPGKILDKTRELVIENFSNSETDVKDGMDISLCMLNTDTLELKWAGANNPLWIVRDGEIIEFKPDKQPVGMFTSMTPFTTHVTKVVKNDLLYLFTDGFADQTGGPLQKKLKISGLRNLVKEMHTGEPAAQGKQFAAAFHAWKGNNLQVDDLCIIGIKV